MLIGAESLFAVPLWEQNRLSRSSVSGISDENFQCSAYKRQLSISDCLVGTPVFVTSGKI